MATRKIDLVPNPRILVARTDRIGDVVLSLPVFASLKSAYPHATICALTRDYTRELLEDRDDVDEVITFESDNAHVPWRRFSRLLTRIKAKQFDVAIALYLNFSIALLFALAGIPRRVGPAAKAAQFLLTDRIRQSRSKGTRHETDHNLDLLTPLSAPPVRSAVMEVPAGRQRIFTKAEGRPLIGVHPGHGGSSRNWPEKNYAELITQLSSAGCDVALTGAADERELVGRVRDKAEGNVQMYVGSGSLKELACALAELDAFVAPSTGPLHIASAVGKPVVGLYCPIFVCLPQRWGPIGPNDTAITPEVEACDKCVDEKCVHFDCMESRRVGKVKEAALGKVRALADA